VISHWNADHTGLISFLDRRSQEVGVNTIIDVHPNRPTARGIAPPPSGKVICQLPRDPSFEEIEAHGGTVEKHRDGHAVAGGTVWVSGEIPRVTPFEKGLIGGVRFTPNEDGNAGSWSEEPVSFGSGSKSPTGFMDIMDERYAAVDVLGKGLVIFSALSDLELFGTT
jgi:7,8-dihydropterin-6-yl-methyl-4-(beta-D-ribofuranosyl)aminobenzene 5'-phosphate synthase